jgi:tRNA pseudouridine55 synthase
VDKPAGPTSHDVVVLARRSLATRRIGHGGTLDPFASGLLPLLVGRATRLMPFIVGLSKRYTGVIRIGARTDTDDVTGTVIATDRRWSRLATDDIAHAMEDLTGPTWQVPPAYSAKKVGGTAAYRRARRGESPDLGPRKVTVHSFHLTERDGPDVAFTADVGSGTYIRALARDLGEALGCGAHVVSLRRTTVGDWRVEDAVSVEALRLGAAPAPPAAVVAHLPRRELTEDERHDVRHGRSIPAAESDEGPVALFAGATLVGVARVNGPLLAPQVVLES